MKIELLETIKTVDNKNLYLPNSVCINANKIIISDGGNNRVCIIDDKQEYSIGTFGIGKYNFKEPVYSVLADNTIFVCDWHNHRVVQYENKKFKNQIGILGNKNENTLKLIFKFLKSLAVNGSYIEKHFNVKETTKFKKSNLQRIKNLIRGLSFYGLNLKILITNIMKKIYINKPNGCIVVNKQLVFTQKNNKCISVYDLEKKEIVKEVDSATLDINFGRLGQICYFEKKIYVCDETNNILWIFSEKLELLDKKTLTSYNLFSIAINKNYITTCGETGFSIFNHDYELLFEKIGDGEYHGVALDKDVLYVCNRLEHQIEKYKIIKDNN